MPDVAIRNAIEQRAVTVAKDWCHRNGWTAVRDVGAGKLRWDLEAVDSSGVRRLIEVKGTTGTSVSMEVTKHEVDSAIQHGCLLTRRRARHRCHRRRHAESDQRCRLCVRPVGAKTVRTRRTEIPVATSDVTVGAALKHGEYPTSEVITVAG